jgi:hypothetical protein
MNKRVIHVQLLRSWGTYSLDSPIYVQSLRDFRIFKAVGNGQSYKFVLGWFYFLND